MDNALDLTPRSYGAYVWNPATGRHEPRPVTRGSNPEPVDSPPIGRDAAYDASVDADADASEGEGGFAPAHVGPVDSDPYAPLPPCPDGEHDWHDYHLTQRGADVDLTLCTRCGMDADALPVKPFTCMRCGVGPFDHYGKFHPYT